MLPMSRDAGADIVELGAVAMAEALAAGRLTSVALVEACLRRIGERESIVEAWAYLDPDSARRQARESDARRSAGAVRGPLDGIPVGVKDIFDTADMPTENGTILHAGRRPSKDS